MHELSIVEALIEQVEQEVTAAGHPGRVVRLELAVGRLSGVYCDALRFAFELLIPGTPLEGAELHIAQPKATCRCHACGAATEVDDLVVKCPRCHSGEIELQGGRDLLLNSIELQD